MISKTMKKNKYNNEKKKIREINIPKNHCSYIFIYLFILLFIEGKLINNGFWNVWATEHSHSIRKSLSTYTEHSRLDNEQLKLARQLIKAKAENKVIINVTNTRHPPCSNNLHKISLT